YTYNLLPWFGPYARVGFETKLLPRYQLLDPPRDVVVLDTNGQQVGTLTAASRIELGSTFAPTQLKQGAGGNFRVLRKSFLELDLRVGLGARQTFAGGLKVYQDATSSTPPELVAAEDSNLFGVEATFIALGRISSFISLSSELEGLAPATGDPVVFTLRNQATVRLVSFLSLNYRFNAIRDPTLEIDKEVHTEHDVQLRFSWVIF